MEIDYVPISTIVNIRNVKELSFENSIGDYHGSFVCIYKHGDSLKDYKKQFEEIYTLYEDGQNFQTALINSNNKELKRLFRDVQICKTDFLGAVKPNEISSMFNNALQFKKKKKIWNDRRLFVDFFQSEEKLYLMFMNHTEKINEVVKELELNCYKYKE